MASDGEDKWDVVIMKLPLTGPPEYRAQVGLRGFVPGHDGYLEGREIVKRYELDKLVPRDVIVAFLLSIRGIPPAEIHWPEYLG